MSAAADPVIRSVPHLELVDLCELERHSDPRFAPLFEAFKQLYAREFPDPREREDARRWPARWRGEEPAPQPHLLVLLALGSTGELLGGICAERYRESRCGLLTYVVVDARARGGGIGRALIEGAIVRLRQAGELRAIFAEAEIPSEMPDALQEGARKRIASLGRLGARPIVLKYVQPELGEGQERARHLMLLLFGHDKPHVERAVVHDFMQEFYRALTLKDPSNDQDFKAMFAQSADYAVAQFEQAVLEAADVAFCLHYVERAKDPFKWAPEDECPVFRSMELDLLSYAFQSPPPLQSTCESLDSHEVNRARDYGADIEVEYPEILTYQSEGRREHLYCFDRRRPLKAYVACTRFPGWSVAIWHVVLRPADGTKLNEFDLIKLVKLYSKAAERMAVGYERAIRFRRDGQTVDATHLLELLGHAGRSGTLMAGTIEWNVPDHAPDGVVKRLPRVDAPADVAGLGEKADDDTPQGRELKALCGVITGILDFAEIGGAEAADTMTPTYLQPGTYIRAHRATFVQVCNEDRAMQAVARTVGISPYLIIPHAAVLFNESLLTDTQQAALLADTQESARGDLHATMNRNLRKGWLQNVFAYGTERTLFKQALVDRGAEDRYAALTQRADEIRALVEERWNARQAALQVIASTLLAFLSGLAVKDALYDFVAPEKPKEPLYVALAIALLVAVVVGWMGWLASRRRKLARSR